MKPEYWVLYGHVVGSDWGTRADGPFTTLEDAEKTLGTAPTRGDERYGGDDAWAKVVLVINGGWSRVL